MVNRFRSPILRNSSNADKAIFRSCSLPDHVVTHPPSRTALTTDEVRALAVTSSGAATEPLTAGGSSAIAVVLVILAVALLVAGGVYYGHKRGWVIQGDVVVVLSNDPYWGILRIKPHLPCDFYGVRVSVCPSNSLL